MATKTFRSACCVVACIVVGPAFAGEDLNTAIGGATGTIIGEQMGGQTGALAGAAIGGALGEPQRRTTAIRMKLRSAVP